MNDYAGNSKHPWPDIIFILMKLHLTFNGTRFAVSHTKNIGSGHNKDTGQIVIKGEKGMLITG
jgi:hypothetical protein